MSATSHFRAYQTCHRLNSLSRERIIWLDALRAYCRENSISLSAYPSYIDSDAGTLEKFVIAPYLFVAKVSGDDPLCRRERILRLNYPQDSFDGYLGRIMVAPGGRYFVSGSSNGWLVVWDIGPPGCPSTYPTAIAYTRVNGNVDTLSVDTVLSSTAGDYVKILCGWSAEDFMPDNGEDIHDEDQRYFGNHCLRRVVRVFNVVSLTSSYTFQILVWRIADVAGPLVPTSPPLTLRNGFMWADHILEPHTIVVSYDREIIFYNCEEGKYSCLVLAGDVSLAKVSPKISHTLMLRLIKERTI